MNEFARDVKSTGYDLHLYGGLRKAMKYPANRYFETGASKIQNRGKAVTGASGGTFEVKVIYGLQRQIRLTFCVDSIPNFTKIRVLLEIRHPGRRPPNYAPILR